MFERKNWDEAPCLRKIRRLASSQMSAETKPEKRLVGCARVSRQSQDLTRQTKVLTRFGCTAIYSDKASRKRMFGRLELACAVDDPDTGDEFVIAERDRARRSMWDGLQIIKAVIDAGATNRILDRPYIDLETPMGRGFVAMKSTMAEDKRLRIIKRAHEGRQTAHANGIRMGRRPKRAPHRMTESRQRIGRRETTRDLAKSYGVNISTILRMAA